MQVGLADGIQRVRKNTRDGPAETATRHPVNAQIERRRYLFFLALAARLGSYLSPFSRASSSPLNFLGFSDFRLGSGLFRFLGGRAFSRSGGRGRFAFLFFSRFFLDYDFFNLFNDLRRLLLAFFISIEAWQFVVILIVRFCVKHLDPPGGPGLGELLFPFALINGVPELCQARKESKRLDGWNRCAGLTHTLVVRKALTDRWKDS